MFQENENELKQENENIYSSNEDAILNPIKTQNIIDTDPYSYISILIIQISKNITKGRGLSQRGVNAFFLFILTGSLLYQHTLFPQDIVGFFNIYLVPLFFLSYFFMDLLKNVQRINRFLLKLFQPNNFTYNLIINDSVTLNELDYYLQHSHFTSEQIINIVENFLKKKQFSPKFQVSLMQNYSTYDVKAFNYMKNILINFEFTSKAVCVFLKKTGRKLEHNYLDKIIEEYGTFPSVQFCIGYYHDYNKNDPDSFYRIGYDFYYKKASSSILIGPIFGRPSIRKCTFEEAILIHIKKYNVNQEKNTIENIIFDLKGLFPNGLFFEPSTGNFYCIDS